MSEDNYQEAPKAVGFDIGLCDQHDHVHLVLRDEAGNAVATMPFWPRDLADLSAAFMGLFEGMAIENKSGLSEQYQSGITPVIPKLTH